MKKTEMTLEKIKSLLKVTYLLTGKKLGKLSVDENNWLKDWSKDNLSIGDDLTSWDHYEERNIKIQKIDSTQEWKRFENKINSNNKTRSINWNIFTKYAAAVLIPIGLILGMWYVAEINSQEEIIVVESIIPPGEKKAILVLSGGQEVLLHDVSSKSIREKNGTMISHLNSKIEYTEGNTESKKNLQPIYNTLKVDHGGEFFVVLSDGTKVWLNSESELRYPIEFNSKSRRVYLVGEGYFEVAKDSLRAFTVETKDYEVEVLGTSFDISSYADDNFISTTLVEGSVKVKNIKGQASETIKLTPNKQFRLKKDDLTTSVRDVNASMYSAWTTGKFVFEDEPLELIFQRLERWYDIDVFHASESVKKQKFTGSLPRFENIRTILALMEEVSNVKFEVKDKTIIIKE